MSSPGRKGTVRESLPWPSHISHELVGQCGTSLCETTPLYAIEPEKNGREGGNTYGRSSEWIPSAAMTRSDSTTAPFANDTRALSWSCSKPVHRRPVCTTPVGSAPAKSSIRSARCMPNVAFQPDESVTCTGAIGVPSCRKDRDSDAHLGPTFSTAWL